MESVKLSPTKYFSKSGPFRYTLTHVTEYGRQEIYLTTTEMIGMMQAMMADFGKKMPKGIKVLVKYAETVL